MGNLILRLLTLITALQVVVSSSAAAAATTGLDVGGALLPHHQLERRCSSTGLLEEYGEGYDVEEEFQMDSEINRRMLAGGEPGQNIGPALKGNMPICNNQRPYTCLPDVNNSNKPGECSATSMYKRTCPKV